MQFVVNKICCELSYVLVNAEAARDRTSIPSSKQTRSSTTSSKRALARESRAQSSSRWARSWWRTAKASHTARSEGARTQDEEACCEPEAAGRPWIDRSGERSITKAKEFASGSIREMQPEQMVPVQNTASSSNQPCVHEQQLVLKSINDSLAVQCLPIQKPFVYRGDPMNFNDWWSLLEDLVGSQPITTTRKLQYLQTYGKHSEWSASFSKRNRWSLLQQSNQTAERKLWRPSGHNTSI